MPIKSTGISAEAPKPKPPVEGERHKQLDREIRDIFSTLTTRLTDLQHIFNPGSSGPRLGDEDEHGVRIIMIAGTNTGATMKGELLDHHQKQHDQHKVFPGDDQPAEGSDTYVNSNCQAVNNSIMLDASYTSNDPGVHMEIEDLTDTPNRRVQKPERRGVRKGKEPVHGNQQWEFSE